MEINVDKFYNVLAGKNRLVIKILMKTTQCLTNKLKGGHFSLSMDLSLQQIVEGLPKSLLNASDKDLEGFQKIIEETIKLREGHRNLQKMVKNFSTSTIQRA